MRNTTQLALASAIFVLFSAGAMSPSAIADTPTSNGIVDSHFHLMSPENWKGSPLAAQGIIDGPIDGAEATRQLDEAGIGKAVVISSGYMFKNQEQALHENDFTAAQVRANPERFVGMCSVSLNHDWALAELERCVNELGLTGLKLHMFADNRNLNDPATLATLDGVFKKAASLRQGMPVLIDFNWMDDAQTMNLLQLAIGNPGTTIIMAHGLGHHFAELINVRLFRDVLKMDLSNLYLDISATLFMYPPDSPPFENYMWHLRAFGTNHIFFGSDFPAKSPADSINTFRKMGFTADEQRQILQTNAGGIFFNK